MIARAAQWNMCMFTVCFFVWHFRSIFRKEGLLPQEDVSLEYLRLAIQYDNKMDNTKYNVMKGMHNRMTTPLGEVNDFTRISIMTWNRKLSQANVSEIWQRLSEFWKSITNIEISSLNSSKSTISNCMKPVGLRTDGYPDSSLEDVLDEVAGTIIAHLSQKSPTNGEPATKMVCVSMEQTC